MKLLTKEIEKELKKFPFLSQDGLGMNARVIVKYFNPYGLGTWLITEGELQEDGDWMLYGYCKITDAEWGYVMLSELQNVKPLMGLGLERDMWIGDSPTVRDLSRNM